MPPTGFTDQNPRFHFTLIEILFVGVLRFQWRVFKPDRTEVVVLTVVDVSHIVPKQAVFQRLQSLLSCHAVGLISTLRFVQEEGSSSHSVMRVQFAKPSEVKIAFVIIRTSDPLPRHVTA